MPPPYLKGSNSGSFRKPSPVFAHELDGNKDGDNDEDMDMELDESDRMVTLRKAIIRTRATTMVIRGRWRMDDAIINAPYCDDTVKTIGYDGVNLIFLPNFSWNMQFTPSRNESVVHQRFDPLYL